MSDRRSKGELVLCIYPSAKGFGFAVFEGSRSLVDWGVKGVHGEKKNAQSLRKMRELLAFYRPDVLVTEDYKGAGSRRGSRIRELIDAISRSRCEGRCSAAVPSPAPKYATVSV